MNKDDLMITLPSSAISGFQNVHTFQPIFKAWSCCMCTIGKLHVLIYRLSVLILQSGFRGCSLRLENALRFLENQHPDVPFLSKLTNFDSIDEDKLHFSTQSTVVSLWGKIIASYNLTRCNFTESSVFLPPWPHTLLSESTFRKISFGCKHSQNRAALLFPCSLIRGKCLPSCPLHRSWS